MSNNSTDVKIKHKLPKYVLTAAQKLREAGFEAYLVGGSVRDILLGKQPKDYDIATNAKPEQVQNIFLKSIPTGAKFGTILVLLPDEQGENFEIEITTYRSETDYFGGRWPTSVEFTDSIEEDLSRRDYTINAIALRLDDNTLEQEDIVDPFAGLADIEKRLLRAVGDPVERFSEDGLRSVRGCRLAANLNFDIEDNTFAAIKQTLDVTKHVSMERVRDELMKLLLNSPKPSKGFYLMKESGLLELFIPELLENIDIDQPQYHVDDVFTHTMKAVDLAEDDVKLAALFHDIGKARTRSEDEKGVHFYGHDVVGAEMTEKIMKRLKFSGADIKRVSKLVRWHMFYYPNADWRKQQYETGKGQDNAVVKLLVVRHAKADLENDSQVTGQLDPSLTAEGIEASKSIASQLTSEKIDIVYSSPLQRAKMTADIIAEELKLRVFTDDRFKERHFGELQGLTWEEFTAKFPSLAGHPDNNKTYQDYLPNGESIAAIESRVRVGLFNLIKSNLGKKLVLVTHSGVIRIIKRVLANIATPDSRKPIDHLERLEFEIKLEDIDPNFLSDEELEVVRQAQSESDERNPGGWSDAAVRRFIRNVGGEELIDDLMKLRIADATANPKSVFNPEEINVLAERIAKVRAEDMAVKVTDLDINGHDLKKMGVRGKQIGKTLDHLLDHVIENPRLNEREKLLELAYNFNHS
jgi:putative nucleotidyltransferase with HDIG domain